jgi:hypothetical protein
VATRWRTPAPQVVEQGDQSLHFNTQFTSQALQLFVQHCAAALPASAATNKHTSTIRIGKATAR